MRKKRNAVSLFSLFIGIISVLSLNLSICYGASTKLALTENGRTKYRIVIPADTDISTKAVAKDFADILKKITGAEFPIVTDAIKKRDLEIIIGANNKRLDELSLKNITKDFTKGEYAIRTVGKKLVIAGGPNRGTINGIYGFLQDHLGCRWYTPGCMKMPKQSTLKLGDIRDHQKPSFARRSTNACMHWDAAWTARNRLNQCLTGGGGTSKNMLMSDDRVKTIGNYPSGHMFSYVPKSLYSQHPEYYAEIAGKRVCNPNCNHRAYCVTNPKFTEWFSNWLIQGRLRGIKGPVQVDISQADTGNNCRCSVCKASYKKIGIPGTYMKFGNAVAEILVKANPEVEIQTYAYGITFNATPVKLHPNIRVIWCPISACGVHAMDECNANLDRNYLQILADWQKQASKIGIWYYHSQSDQLMPHMLMSSTAKNFKTYNKMGIDYVFTEVGPAAGIRSKKSFDGDKHLSAYGNTTQRDEYFTTPFGLVHLREYLVTQLLWNTNYDWRAGLKEFCDYYYGPAGKEMTEFALMVENSNSYEKTMNNVFKSYSGVHQNISLAPKPKPFILKKWNSIFNIAFEKVKDNKTYLRRVEMARTSVDLAIMVYTRTNTALRQQAFKRFFALMEELELKKVCRTAVTQKQPLAKFKKLMSHPEKLVIPGEEPIGSNLLQNSSFEIAIMGTGIPNSWSGEGSYLPEGYSVDPAGINIDSTKAYSGKNSVRLTKAPKKKSIVSLRQRFDVQPGERYHASVRYQTNIKTGGLYIIFTAFDKNGKWLRHQNGSRGINKTGDKWRKLSLATTAKADTAQLMIEVFFYNDKAKGVAWIDDFECAKIKQKK